MLNNPTIRHKTFFPLLLSKAIAIKVGRKPKKVKIDRLIDIKENAEATKNNKSNPITVL